MPQLPEFWDYNMHHHAWLDFSSSVPSLPFLPPFLPVRQGLKCPSLASSPLCVSRMTLNSQSPASRVLELQACFTGVVFYLALGIEPRALSLLGKYTIACATFLRL